MSFIPRPYSTRRLTLRPLETKDFDAWLVSQRKTLAPKDKFDTAALPPERRTRAVFAKAVRQQSKEARKDSRYFLKGTGELVGFIDVKPISRYPHQLADIGYFITNSYRKKGYAKEALRKLVPSIFKDLELHRLEALIDLDNRPSILLAKKSGFHREGIRKHYWPQNGRWDDMMVFVATPELFK